MTSDENGWKEYRKLVLGAIEYFHKCNEKQEKKIQDIEVDLAVLKVKAGIIAGVIGACVALLVKFVQSVLIK